MPEWIGSMLFFAAIVFTASKLNDDFRNRALLGYSLLTVMITIYAGAVGLAYI